MLNIAHRGFKSEYPENTMIAFKKSVDLGVDGIEFDVHLSKDGELVIIHDERLDRTTDGKGRIQDFNLEELKRFNAANLYKEIEFQSIPTLEEYLEYIYDKRIITNIELKTGVYWYDEIEKKVYNLIKEYNLEDKIIISSFNHKSLVKFKKIDNSIKCGALVDTWLIKPWEYLKKINVEYYHPSAYCVDEYLVKELHSNGKKINVWSGSEEYNYEKMISYGVDGIISDYPNIINSIKCSRKINNR